MSTRVAASLYTTAPEADRSPSGVLRKPGAVDVWRFAYAAAPAGAARRIERWLPAEEVRAARRFVLPELEERFLLRRGFVRCVLARYLEADARLVAFGKTARGKPFVLEPEAGDLAFNVSHTDDEALLAVASGMAVGVDIERVAADLDPKVLGPAVFAPSEAAWMAREGADEKRSFLRIWCRKEACLKATGIGLLDDLTTLSVLEEKVDLRACPDRRIEREEATLVHVQDLPLGAAHVGALATTAECPAVAATPATLTFELDPD